MYELLFNQLQFPVAPESVKISIKDQNETVTLINGREINIPKLPGLTEFSFDLLLPASPYPFAVYPDGFHSPDYYLHAISKLKEEKTDFLFKMDQKLPGGRNFYNIEKRVLIEDYTISEDASEGFDVTVSMKLKEYMDYSTVKVDLLKKAADGQQVATEQPQRQSKEPAKTYTVKKGDNLWLICKRELGDGNRYPEIAKLNGIANANLIHPGQVIRFA